jgi:hypothetical protein
VGDVARDTALALRRLAQSPLFTAFSVVTLALGIGITTAAYSILYSLLWRDPAIADVSGLLSLSRPIAWADHRDLLEQQTSFRGVAARAEFGASLSARGEADLVSCEAVSGNYFQILDLSPALGRLLRESDDEPGAPAVVVLSTAVWRSQFSADPSIVGSSVRLGGRIFEVASVAPIGSAASDGDGAPDWRLDHPRRGAGARRRSGRRSCGLRPRPAGFRVAEHSGADAELAAIMTGSIAWRRSGRPASAINTRDPVRGWEVRPALDRSRLANTGEAARVLLAVPALVLLVACTNLANLVLSRGLLRRQEHSIRQALGASRWRLVRPPFIESAVVAFFGGIGGTLVTWGLLRWSSVTFEETFGFFTTVRLDGRLEPEVFAAAGLSMLLALVVAGVVPAMRLTRGDLHRHLTVDAAASGLMRWRGRSNLIALQVAASVALLLITALSVRVLPSIGRRPGPAPTSIARPSSKCRSARSSTTRSACVSSWMPWSRTRRARQASTRRPRSPAWGFGRPSA